jgi:hypothetical protein
VVSGGAAVNRHNPFVRAVMWVFMKLASIGRRW